MVQQKPRSVDSESRGWLINITICFGDFNLPICRDKAQNSPDLLVESSAWQGKTSFEVSKGNGEFFNFFPYCHNCRPMAQNWDWGLGTGDWKENYHLCKRSIDYPVFLAVELMPERCAEIHKGTRSKILRLVCSVRVRLVNT
ncbi:hypothetical protein A4S05_04915 [Nostoc sp. KVJ20]|uniref:hypothetical protein n=1 Tax=Nostoc sp. KVJ20 TaxID=457944 RepID=UPI00083CDACB|nr:hypothetical protein [Nostoc sp. KVJ20]ODG99385.1 hypothetical protein A4S05_04915 [Nostoc sp. KVJ20]